MCIVGSKFACTLILCLSLKKAGTETLSDICPRDYVCVDHKPPAGNVPPCYCHRADNLWSARIVRDLQSHAIIPIYKTQIDGVARICRTQNKQCTKKHRRDEQPTDQSDCPNRFNHLNPPGRLRFQPWSMLHAAPEDLYLQIGGPRHLPLSFTSSYGAENA